MFTKATGFLIVPLWLGAMGWLVAHDIWPGVSAADPPALEVSEWLRDEGRQAQYSIIGSNGKIGTIWSEYMIDRVSVQREDVIWVDRLGGPVGAVRITVHIVYTREGHIDEFTLTLRAEKLQARLHGERFHTNFSFSFESTGLNRRTFKIPLSEAGLISGGLTPFAQFRDLKVGQRWRMQMFNPIAAITGIGDRFVPVLATVTGRERLSTEGGVVDCWVIESSKTRAWINAHGGVHQQEVTLPVFGTFRIHRQPGFDAEARTWALRRSFATH